MNWYLRFTDRTAADKALAALPGYMLTDDDGNPVAPGKHCSGKGWHGYHIGPMAAKTQINGEGVEVTIRAADPRHHVNIMATTAEGDEILKANAALAVTYPATPEVTWQGGVADVEPDFFE